MTPEQIARAACRKIAERYSGLAVQFHENDFLDILLPQIESIIEQRDKLLPALQAVIDRDAEWAASGSPTDCNCANLSRDADREYEAGECPHQKARELIAECKKETE